MPLPDSECSLRWWLAMWELKDLLALSALALGIYNTWMAHRSKRTDPILQEVLQLLDQLRQNCKDVCLEIQKNLAWVKGHKDAKGIYQLQKIADERRELIERRLPEQAREALVRGYTAWWKAASCHFPVDNKSACFQKNGAEWVSVDQATKTFLDHIDRLRLSCQRRQTKIT